MSQDYIALEWVKGEIQDTLQQAQQSLEAYGENPHDKSRLKFCFSYLHQVHGTLQMVEFYGAALLAEEMELVASALADGQIRNERDGLSILMQAIIQLPHYLDHVKVGNRDLPVVLLPVLNELRSARGENLLSETALFNPRMVRRAVLTPAKLSRYAQDDFSQWLRKVRQMYQAASAQLLQNRQPEVAKQYLLKVFTRLHSALGHTPNGVVWLPAMAFAEWLTEQASMPASAKLLLRELDTMLKQLMQEGAGILNHAASDELVKNLLFYIVRTDVKGEAIAQAQKAYHLAEALPSEDEIQREREALSGPDRDTIGQVLTALAEEIAAVKERLDLAMRDQQGRVEPIGQVIPALKQVCDTMGMLGIGRPRSTVQDQLIVLSRMVDDGTTDNAALFDVAGALLFVEATLAGMIREGNLQDSGESAALTDAQKAVLREARNVLEQVKDAIVAYVGNQWNTDELNDVPALLYTIAGSLRMVPMPDVARVLSVAAPFVEQLIASGERPDWATLDGFADVLSGAEYVIERHNGKTDLSSEKVLDKVWDALEQITGVSRHEITAEIDEAGEEVAAATVEIDAAVQQAPLAESVQVEKVTNDVTEAAVETVVEPVAIETAVVEVTEPQVTEAPVVTEPVAVVEESSLPESVIAETAADTVESAEEAAVVAPSNAASLLPPAPIQVADIQAAIDSDLIDEDIIEVFLEEASEVTATLDEAWPVYRADNSDSEALTTVRRAFHTLKGSGRMVQALIIGELAWSVENLFNRVIDRTVAVTPPLVDLVDHVISVLPLMIEDFRLQRTSSVATQPLMDYAFALASGVDVPALALVTGAVLEAEPAIEADHVVADVVADITETVEDAEVVELDEDDLALLEVFSQEASGHLAVVGDYLQTAREHAFDYPVCDQAQRALHTLKGSAHMAGLTGIAAVAGPMERLLKELRAYSIGSSGELVELLEAGCDLINGGLENLQNLSSAELAGTADYLQQLNDFESRIYSQLNNEDVASSKVVNPQAIANFLASGMDSLLEADLLLGQWQHGDSSVLDLLCKDLVEVAKGADEADQQAIAELAGTLNQFYMAINQSDENFAVSRRSHWMALATEGQEQLLNMMDCLAAGQALQRATIIEDLQRATAEIQQWQPEAEDEAVVDLASPAETADDAEARARAAAIELQMLGEMAIEQAADDASEADVELAIGELEQLLEGDTAAEPLLVIEEPEADSEYLTLELEAEDSVQGYESDSVLTAEPMLLVEEEPAEDEYPTLRVESEEPEQDLESDLGLTSEPMLLVEEEPAEDEYPTLRVESEEPEQDLESDLGLTSEPMLLVEEESAEDEYPTLLVEAEEPEQDFESNLGLTAEPMLLVEEEPAEDEYPTLLVEAEEPEQDLESDLGLAVEPMLLVEEESAEDEYPTLLVEEDEQELGQTSEPSLFVVDDNEGSDEQSADSALLTVEDSIGFTNLEAEDDLSLIADPQPEPPSIELSAESDDNFGFELQTEVEIPDAEVSSHEIDAPQTEAWHSAEVEFSAADADPAVEPAPAPDFSMSEPASVEYIAPPALEMDEGMEEIVEIFLEESDELIESIDQALNEWQQDPDNLVSVARLQRDLHTIKGGARMAELAEIADLCHELETLYERINNGRLGIGAGLFELLQTAHDTLGSQLDQVRVREAVTPAVSMINALRGYLAGDNDAFAALAAETSEAPAAQDDDAALADDLPISAEPVVAEPVAAEPVPAIEAVSVSMDESDREILEIFLDEAAELHEALDQALHDWKQNPSNNAASEEAQRVLHTLKGGARLAGLLAIGDQAHDFESIIVKVQQGYLTADTAFFADAYQRQDALVSAIDKVSAALESGDQVMLGDDGLATTSNDFEQPVLPVESASVESSPVTEDSGDAAGLPTDIDEIADEAAEPEQQFIPHDEPQISASSNVVPIRPSADTEVTTPKLAGTPLVDVATAAQQVAARRAPQELVKVSADLLDDLVNLAGETSIGRGRLEQQVTDFSYTLEEMEGTLDRLRDQLRRLDIETEAQVLFRQERQGPDYEDFDPLEMDRYSTIQQLSRALVESASDLLDLKETLSDKTRDAETLLLQQSRVNTELQEGLMKTRMVQFQRLVPRLRRIVRQVSLELGKQVDFRILNAEGELDRTILERMISPLEHMVRNAVDHGIESLEERRAAGKPDVGSIELEVGREGGDVMIVLRDDGKGINREAVRAKAIERGLLAAGANVSDHDLLQFILQAGFSTAKNVTQISGRGVGLDVVSTEIKQMGGTVEIQSEQGQGTRFVVRLPFTVSVNRALMVRLGDDLYAVPLNNIRGIVRVSGKDLQELYELPAHERAYEYAGNKYPLEYLGVMLENESQPKIAVQNLPIPVLLVNGAVPYALQVDTLLGSREIVVKTLGPQFASVAGVSGGTILGDGSVVVILDLPALIRTQASLEYQQARMLDMQMAEQRHELAQRPARILVVDDSVTVRKVTSRLLERHGMEVMTANDGVDAMATLQDHMPDLMLLDIEMPRMDGFELASLVRHDTRLKHIPIIMITSRTGDKHRERAMSIGVNEYLGKPFQEDTLLGTMNRLLGREDSN
ncbi:Hpt domain-containing protein [Oceanobacter mangrovi]|uniref:hybrid sensor histidine kinase/response regulator n=1 Tax=Oceanobacter mangrovi TaxID=2862510 RepID=UPI001C8E4F69|nr:Hpt domain-containing protein [Oceanobacter mangrovi]